MKILVVDDELVSRSKMQKIMEQLGECEAVQSGREGLDAFKNAWESWAPFDLITLDVGMPEMDGTEVLYRIRQMEDEKNVPKNKRARIFMVTAHSDKDTVITSIQAGCSEYIAKPFNKETVLAKLKKQGLLGRLATD